MYKRGKYVVGEVQDRGLPTLTAVLVNEVVNHSSLSNIFVPGTITGAGFFTVSVHPSSVNPHVRVYGESVSLGIKCDPERDLKWVKRTLGIDD